MNIAYSPYIHATISATRHNTHTYINLISHNYTRKTAKIRYINAKSSRCHSCRQKAFASTLSALFTLLDLPERYRLRMTAAVSLAFQRTLTIPFTMRKCLSLLALLCMLCTTTSLPISAHSAHVLLTGHTLHAVSTHLTALPHTLLNPQRSRSTHIRVLINVSSEQFQFVRLHANNELIVHVKRGDPRHVKLPVPVHTPLAIRVRKRKSSVVVSIIMPSLAVTVRQLLAACERGDMRCVRSVLKRVCGKHIADSLQNTPWREGMEHALSVQCGNAKEPLWQWAPALVYAVLFTAITACQIFVMLWGAAFALSFTAVEIVSISHRALAGSLRVASRKLACLRSRVSLAT